MAFAASAGLYVIVGVNVLEYVTRQSFDSEKWKKSEGCADPIRLKMVDDLLHRYKLVGMSRAELVGLLGVPRKTDYFSDFEYVYWLGPERGFISIDSEWLGIKFANDTVSEAQMLRD